MLHVDSVCSGLLVDHEYRKDSLQYMYNMQRDLQIFMSNKRGSLSPQHKPSTQKLNEAWYYWGCTGSWQMDVIRRSGKKIPTNIFRI